MTTSARALAGRHAVVTGGGRGIGAAIARRLADEGARLSILGRSPETLELTAKQLPDRAEAFATACDVTDPDAVASVLDAVRRRHGPVDVLVNSAGQGASSPLARTTDETWRRMLDVNLTGTFFCIRRVLPDMVAAGEGCIVNIASTAGLRGYAYVTAYAAAKHGVVGLTRALAAELAGTRITVNAVCPGFTDTDLLRETVANVMDKTGRSAQAALAELARHNPQGRIIEPDEVADAVAWLCSPARALDHRPIHIDQRRRGDVSVSPVGDLIPVLPDERLGFEARAVPSDHLDVRLWLRLLACTNQIEQEIRTRLRVQFGTTLARFDYLAQLERRPEGLRMSALSKYLMVSGGNVTGLTDQLVGDGWVDRVPDPTDKRATLLRLTGRGRSRFEEIAAAHERWLIEMFCGFGRDQEAALFDLLGRFRARIAARDGEHGVAGR